MPLWHVGCALPFIAPEIPAVAVPAMVIYDLLKGGYLVEGLLNEGRRHYQVVPRKPADAFSPAALAGEGIREV